MDYLIDADLRMKMNVRKTAEKVMKASATVGRLMPNIPSPKGNTKYLRQWCIILPI